MTLLRSIACGRLFWLDVHDGTRPPERIYLRRPAVLAHFAGAAPVLVGEVHGGTPLLAARDGGPVLALVDIGTEHEALIPVAASRSALDQIADWLALLWGGREAEVALPWDPPARAVAVEVLAEIAKTSPEVDIGFWRHEYFRQYDIHYV